MTKLEELASLIRAAKEQGLVPGEKAMARWDEMAQTAVLEANERWFSERDFRSRTHASDNWCRQNFDKYEAEGLARRGESGKREWHIHARLPHAAQGNRAAIKQRILESFGKAS